MPHLTCSVDDELDSYMSGPARHAGSDNTPPDLTVRRSEKATWNRKLAEKRIAEYQSGRGSALKASEAIVWLVEYHPDSSALTLELYEFLVERNIETVSKLAARGAA